MVLGVFLKLHRDLWTQAYYRRLYIPWLKSWAFPTWDESMDEMRQGLQKCDICFSDAAFTSSDHVCAVLTLLHAGSSLKLVFLPLCTLSITEKWWNHFHFLVNNKKSHCEYLLILSGLCLRNNAFLCNSSYLGVLLVPRFCSVRPWDALQLVLFWLSILLSRATG